MTLRSPMAWRIAEELNLNIDGEDMYHIYHIYRNDTIMCIPIACTLYLSLKCSVSCNLSLTSVSYLDLMLTEKILMMVLTTK